MSRLHPHVHTAITEERHLDPDLVAALIWAQPANRSPFGLSAVLDRTAAVPGETFRIGFVLEVPAKHKIYQSSIKAAFPATDPVEVMNIEVPEGRSSDLP